MSTLLREESYTGNEVTRKQKTTPQILGAHQSLQIRGPLDAKLWKSLKLITWFLVAWGCTPGHPTHQRTLGVCLALVTPLSEEKVENCSLRCFAKKCTMGKGQKQGGTPTPLLSPPLAREPDPGGCLSPSPSGGSRSWELLSSEPYPMAAPRKGAPSVSLENARDLSSEKKKRNLPSCKGYLTESML